MYYTLDMQKNGEEPKTWELDVCDTFDDIWTILEHLKERCINDPDCPKDYWIVLHGIQNYARTVMRNKGIVKAAVEKNPTYFKD